MKIRLSLLYLFILISLFNKAQSTDSSISFDQYPFIQLQNNGLQHYSDDFYMNQFFQKLEELNFTGKGQINIVHIGGSHVQADMFTNRLRYNFQSFEGGMNAGRGFIFPYRLAKTNTSSTYHFESTGKWECCRNVDKDKFCKLGVGGITAVTNDSLSSLTFAFRKANKIKYDFNRIKIFHEIDSVEFQIQIDSLLVKSIVHYPEKNYSEVFFFNYLDSLTINFVKTDSLQNHFTLYGILAETDESGIYCHNLGINGASVPSFLNTSEFESQLEVIHPDLVILGLGINDAHSKDFSEIAYEYNYNELIRRIRKANPNAAIIFITNNDSYLTKRKVNRNGILVQQTLVRVAKENGAAVWDLFEIMGGLNSIVKWQKNGLAQRDKIHFTKIGYEILGDLLFESIVESYFNYLKLNYKN